MESLSLDEKGTRQTEQVSPPLLRSSFTTSTPSLLLVRVRQNCSESQNVGVTFFEQAVFEASCLFRDFRCWNLWPHLPQENTFLPASPGAEIFSLLLHISETGNKREEFQISRSGKFEAGSSGRRSGKREALQDSGRTELPSISGSLISFYWISQRNRDNPLIRVKLVRWLLSWYSCVLFFSQHRKRKQQSPILDPASQSCWEALRTAPYRADTLRVLLTGGGGGVWGVWGGRGEGGPPKLWRCGEFQLTLLASESLWTSFESAHECVHCKRLKWSIMIKSNNMRLLRKFSLMLF